MLRCAITDRSYLIGDASRWAEDGVDFVQLRDKALDAGNLAKLARAILADLAQIPETSFLQRTPQLLINGRADIAVAVGAAGVHLTTHLDELTPEQVRRVFEIAGRPVPIVSVSCHTLEEVRRASATDADIILFGPVFEKRVGGEQVSVGVGLEALHAACVAAGEVPVLALGGITAELIEECLRMGAKGIAGIRLFA